MSTRDVPRDGSDACSLLDAVRRAIPLHTFNLVRALSSPLSLVCVVPGCRTPAPNLLPGSVGRCLFGAKERAKSLARGGLLWTVALAFAAASLNSIAAATPHPDDLVYAIAAVLETEEELAGQPRTLFLRSYLPPSVDLTDRFPTPGRQGEQSSCVGSAGGYAARTYHNRNPPGELRLAANQTPSPACIYDSNRRLGAGP